METLVINPHVEHYRARVNSSYQQYFEQRYKPFLAECSKHSNIKEEGIGIGSVSKALRKEGIHCYGSDLSMEMLELCIMNNPGILCFKEDMLNRDEVIVSQETAIITHGVLEHFSNDEIRRVLDQYNESPIKYSIHYVPTGKYNKPSIGDERLLPWQFWVGTFRPAKYVLFNNQHDLMLVFKH